MTENNRIEYKRELTDNLEKEVVAFLNARDGGAIYLGIDKDGNAHGVDDCDTTQLAIKDRLKNNIQPSIMGLFEIIPDRVEVTSKGGLPYGIDEEDFFSGCSVPRNKEIMRVFRDLEIVEHLGSGVPRILSKYGREAFEIRKSSVRVIFRFAKPLSSSISSAQVEAQVLLICQKQPSSSGEIARALGHKL